MDEKDLKLISLLRRNARAPIVALARHIGLSRSATQDRMARLEGSGAIAGYRVVEGTPGTMHRLRASILDYFQADHGDFRSDRPEIMNVIDSDELRGGMSRKPAS